MSRQQVEKVNQAKDGRTHTPLSQPTTDFHATNADHESILDMQRLVGNQATQRLLSGGFLQTKMSVSTPDDAYEQEADQVAQQVMTMPAPLQREAAPDEAALATKRIQRDQQDEDDKLQMKSLVQRDDALDDDDPNKLMAKRDSVPTVTPDIEAQIEQGRGSGQAMPASAQSFFEPRFGQDFSNVRIHTGEEADALNRDLEARAFTNQSDIYFRSGEYQPDTSAGRELLAHELTHVVQQGGSAPIEG